MRKSKTASCLTLGAILLTSSWIVLSPAQTNPVVPATARKELQTAAKAHGVSIKVDKIAYVNNQRMTIVSAPIMGIEKYSLSDFATGAPIRLMIIKSKLKLAVPDGSYVVKVHAQRSVKSGKASFTNSAGDVVAQRDLDQPLLILNDPLIPNPTDEFLGIDNCSIYRERFPHKPVCAECACTYYHNSPGTGISGDARDPNAFIMGLLAGEQCARSTPSTCR